MPTALTERQHEALSYIGAYAREHKSIPTLREIGAALGLRSPNAVVKIVDALVAKGHLTRTPHVARGLRLVDTAALGAGPSEEGAPLVPVVLRAPASGLVADLRKRPAQFLALDAQLLPRSADPDACLFVRAGDDGMNPDGVRMGDLVVVEACEAADLANGTLAAFLVGEALQVRRFHAANGKWHLRPADRRYTEDTYAPDDPALGVIGRAHALVRRLA